MISTLLLPALLSQSFFTDDGGPKAVELLVDLVDGTSDQERGALEQKIGHRLVLNSVHSADEDFYLTQVADLEAEEILAILRKDPRVEHAEPNFLFSIPENEDPAPSPPTAPAPGDAQPNDPLYPAQWSFKMIDVESAWKKSQGQGVVVAVIDTGVAFEDYKRFRRVEDLSGTEFVTGYDFIHDTDHPNDDHGHGTHVAGTIAQTTNNKVGVAGIAPKAKIMPLKVLSASGSGTAGDIADAIRFAADEGAQVINMSLGGGMRSLVMESAVAYARKKGVVVVCAAGNASRGKVEYPAAYPGAFAVSSVGPSGKLAYYSSWGKELAIAAPGGDKQEGGDQGAILQNTIEPNRVAATNLYLAFQGTSMATPHVAGVAALIMGTGVTNPDQVEAVLKGSAVPHGAEAWDERYGHGVLHAGRAVEMASMMSSGWFRFFAVIFAVVAMLVRWRDKLPFKASTGAAVLIAGAGLPFVSALGGPFQMLGQPLPAWDLYLFGAGGHGSFLVMSVLPMLALSVSLLHFRNLRGLLIGLSVGWAIHLGASAYGMPADVLGVPGMAGWLDRLWLLVNAGALLFLASLIARVSARR